VKGDDEYRAAAIQALIALRADLDRAIDGPRPSPGSDTRDRHRDARRP
jgi:hypothetical protein